MKLLVPVSEKLLNPYPREIYDHLRKKDSLTYDFGLNRFWLPDEFDYDIIHIHWPETLITNLLNPGIIVNSDHFRSELFSMDMALRRWKDKGTRIVLTRHNDVPHQGKSEFYELLYRIIYRHADAVVHLGQFSLEQISASEEYVRDIKHVVIPHSMYTTYPTSASREESRAFLGIPGKAFTMLVFGSVRNDEEASFILDVFRQIQARSKILVAPRWNIEDFTRHGRALGAVHKMRYKLWLRCNRQFRFDTNRASIVDAEVQYYFNAADVVLSPRFQSLNSGVIPLAFSFGKPVVGPDCGNISELLRNCGNPVFTPGDAAEAAAAINSMIKSGRLAKQGIQNLEYARLNWNLEGVSKSHLELFNSLLRV